MEETADKNEEIPVTTETDENGPAVVGNEEGKSDEREENQDEASGVAETDDNQLENVPQSKENNADDEQDNENPVENNENDDGGDGSDHDNESTTKSTADKPDKKPDTDKNGPEYVNLRGSIGRVHESELEKDEIEDLKKVQLYPTHLTKGKIYHEFSDEQIEVLSKVRDSVWERFNRKNNPPLPPKVDNEPRMEQQMQQQQHPGQFLHHQQQMQQMQQNPASAVGYPFVQGNSQFLMPQFGNYLRMSHDQDSMQQQQQQQQRGQGKRQGGNQNNNNSKKMRGYPYIDDSEAAYQQFPHVAYMQQPDYMNMHDGGLPRRYPNMQSDELNQQGGQDPQHLFDMQI